MIFDGRHLVSPTKSSGIFSLPSNMAVSQSIWASNARYSKDASIQLCSLFETSREYSCVPTNLNKIAVAATETFQKLEPTIVAQIHFLGFFVPMSNTQSNHCCTPWCNLENHTQFRLWHWRRTRQGTTTACYTAVSGHCDARIFRSTVLRRTPIW